MMSENFEKNDLKYYCISLTIQVAQLHNRACANLEDDQSLSQMLLNSCVGITQKIADSLGQGYLDSNATELGDVLLDMCEMDTFISILPKHIYVSKEEYQTIRSKNERIQNLFHRIYGL